MRHGVNTEFNAVVGLSFNCAILTVSATQYSGTIRVNRRHRKTPARFAFPASPGSEIAITNPLITKKMSTPAAPLVQCGLPGRCMIPIRHIESEWCTTTSAAATARSAWTQR